MTSFDPLRAAIRTFDANDAELGTAEAELLEAVVLQNTDDAGVVNVEAALASIEQLRAGLTLGTDRAVPRSDLQTMASVLRRGRPVARGNVFSRLTALAKASDRAELLGGAPFPQALSARMNDVFGNLAEYLERELPEGASNGNVTREPTSRERTVMLAMPADERLMFDRTLTELERFAAGETNAAEYMATVADHAAEIAGDNGRTFSRLLNVAFSSPPDDLFERNVVGAGAHFVGHRLESASAAIATARHGGGSTPDTGINHWIRDDQYAGSTVTHHFVGFYLAGARTSPTVGKLAGMMHDDPGENIGDVRNAYFASMLGDAVQHGQLHPSDASRFLRWAITDHRSSRMAGVKWSDYNIRKWVTAFNEDRGDAAQITLRQRNRPNVNPNGFRVR